jgi:hypothetical protein
MLQDAKRLSYADISARYTVELSKAKETSNFNSVRTREIKEEKRRRQPPHGDWWEVEPDMVRMVHGVADASDRVAALGDGQVPLQAAVTWVVLWQWLAEKWRKK